MSALTKKERDGLEDVFLSIHSNNNKYSKFKEFSSFSMTKNMNNYMHTLLKRAKFGLHRSKFPHIFANFYKKKK